MRLFYRGIGYDREPLAVNTVDSGVEGMYRGQRFHFNYARHIPVAQPVVHLNYRSVPYRITADGRIETAASVCSRPAQVREQPVARVEQPHVWFASQQAIKEDVSKIHQANIQRRLQHRLEVAKEKGDQSLIHQLEQEMQLVR